MCDKCATKTLLSRAHHRVTGKLESCRSGQRALRVVAVKAEWSGGLAVTSRLPRSMKPLFRLRTFTGRLFPVTVRQPIHRLFVETSYQPVNTVICACSTAASIPTPVESFPPSDVQTWHPATLARLRHSLHGRRVCPVRQAGVPIPAGSTLLLKARVGKSASAHCHAQPSRHGLKSCLRIPRHGGLRFTVKADSIAN